MDNMDYKALLKDALIRLDAMQAEIEFERQASAEARQLYSQFHEPVAVIGMGCRLPGGVKDPAGYWQLLVEGRDTSGEVPASRWDVNAYYDPDPAAPAKIYTRKGSFIDNPELFDPQFFNISPREATSLDPQQRLLLEVSWEALESANIVPANLYGSQTGVFVGISSSEYLNGTALGKRENDLLEKIDPYFGTGNAFSTATGRISYTLRLMGPNVAVDTACSSSLSAIYLACMSLRNGKCDLALAGGVNMILTPAVHITLSKARMISPDGACKTFDAGADGYLRGEGCGMIVLKRLTDAQRDGDEILALIRGGAMNQDGASSGLTVPSGPSQQAVVRQALEDAGVGPEEISYVEAHGTGTFLGDPIEAGALAQVFGPFHDDSNPLYIGAVKTNIGHLESASGIASVIKTILALQHAEIPRNLHFTQLNPNIPWDGLALHVPTSHIPWQAKRRLAGVSGFGFGGTNVHLVLEEAGASTQAVSGFSEDEPLPDLPRILCLSARSEQALTALARSYADFLQDANPADWPSICHTTHQHRSLFRYRLALVAANPQEAAAELSGFAAGQRSPNLFSGQPSEVVQPQLAFLFTGQGAQYAGMGRDLYTAEPVFRQHIDACSALLGSLGDYSLLDVLFPTEAQKDLIHATMYTQPALFALEYALGKLLESWGIQAEVMMGHSIGEYAAACLAGVFSLEDGLRLVAARGRLMGSLPQGGGMLSVFASLAQVEDALAALRQAHGGLEVGVAAVNAPENVVVSGAGPALDALRAILDQQGVRSEALQVSHAFHSPLMEPILAQFCSVAGGVTYHAPTRRLVSNLHGRLAGEDDMRSAAYWAEHIRQGVQFMAGMQSIQQFGASIYLELGPRPALIGLGKECLGAAAPDAIWTPTLRPGKSDRMQLAACLAQLFAAGYPVSWQAFDRRGGANGGDLALRRVSLPTYAFQRQRYWIDYTDPDSAAAHKETEPHPLLGAALDLAGAAGMYFENSIGLHSPAYLEDHRLFHEPVFPGAAFVEMSLAAGRAFFPAGQGLSIQGARIEQPLIFAGSERVSLQTALRPMSDGAVEINIYSRSPHQTGWLRHFTAVLRSGSFPPSPDAPTLGEALSGAAQSEPANLAAFYFRRSLQGFDYGPAFQGLESVRRIPSQTGTAYFVTARLPEALQAQASQYTWHPAVLDALLQPLADQTTDPSRLPLPVAFEHLTLHLPPASVASSQLDVCMQIGTPDPATAEILVRFYFYNPEGLLIASATGQIIAVERMAFFRLLNKAFGGWFYHLDWAALEAPAPGAERPGGRGEWLVCADDEGVADRLAERLLSNGDEVTLVVLAQEGTATIGQNGGGLRRLMLDPLDVGAWQTLVQGLQNRPVKGIIHLWNLSVRQPLDGPAANLPDHQALGVGSLLHLVQACSLERGVRAPRLWLVTRGAWMVKPEQKRLSPLHAAALGLGRGIYFEHNEYELVSLDLDPDSDDLDLDAKFLFQQLQYPDAEDLLALRGSQRWGLRLKPGWTRQAQRPLGKAFHLAIGEYGLLEFLHLAPLERRAPGPDEVEIEVRAAGLNLRDVLNALGMLRQFAAELGIENAQNLPFGGECAGVITALGANAVGHFRVGEEVIAGMAPGSLASHVNARLDAVMRKPAHLSFEEAATLPTVSLTVYYGLHVLARIQPGERVLIHAAAGGVGQAALQYAQRMGAEVFATASPGKWDFMRAQGVTHIYNSRSLDFREQILADTGGEGVQIVLNSLAGEFIPASLAVLAAGGRFVEIGKLGIMTPEFFSAQCPDAAYYPFDLMEIAISRPELLRQLFGELAALWADGTIQPLPRTVFSITEAEAAFRFMAQARHTGKVVIVPPPPPVKIRPDAVYLITGGLGGLGLQVAGWLVYQGARRLVLVGRSGAASSEAQAGVAALRSLGAEVQTAACDVSDSAAVDRLLAEIKVPLAGVIHAAGVTGSGMIRQHTWAEFSSQTRPKILGAWNLHRATLGIPLDFFVCFSSIGAMVCSPGQSSYAAGNLFMDALMQARRAAGYPGTTINWGPWAEVGMVPRLEAHLQQGQIASGLQPFSNAAGRMAFEAVVERICAPRLPAGQTVPCGVEQAFVVAVDWNKLVAFAPQAAGAPVFGALITAAPGSGRQRGELLEKLKTLPAGERKPFLFKAVQEALSTILNLPAANIEPHQRLLDFGMDSLMAIEFKNNLEISLACTLPATVVFDYPTVGGVTDFLLDDLLRLDAAPVSSAPADLVETPAAIPADISEELLAEVLDEVEGLSDSEVALRLGSQNSGEAA